MRLIVVLVSFMLAFSANAQQIYTLDHDVRSTLAKSETVSALRAQPVAFAPIGKRAAAPAPEPSVTPLRCGLEGVNTVGASISVLGPDEDGKYKVPISIWFPVPEGVTFTVYAIHSDDAREYISHYTVTAETAGSGFAGNVWGPFTGGAPIPEDIVGFRLEFTGAFPTYSVNTSVPSPGRTPVLVDVHPDGKLFLRVWMCPDPVASLFGRVHPIVNGWITPMEGYSRPDTPITLCSGYPDSVCLTQVSDIPKATP